MKRGCNDGKGWYKCKHMLTNASIGSEAKNSRWWSIEVQARNCSKRRSSEAMLVAFVGYKRGWWGSFYVIQVS